MLPIFFICIVLALPHICTYNSARTNYFIAWRDDGTDISINHQTSVPTDSENYSYESIWNDLLFTRFL